jgi:dienelactone hydrolase
MGKLRIIPIILILILAACQNTPADSDQDPAADSSSAENSAAVSESDPADGDIESSAAGDESTEPTAAPTAPQPTATAAAEVSETAPEVDESDLNAAISEPTAPQAPQPAGQPEEITVDGLDGLRVAGTFYPGSGPAPWPGVILLHMNGGNRADWDAFAGQLADSGYAALAVDLRAHGDTGGERDWDKAAGDLQRVWEYLAGRDDVDETKTAVAGASIGANMALVTGAAEPHINTVILLSPGQDYFGVTTDDKIVEYGDRPILVVASQEDTQAAGGSELIHELAIGQSELQMYQGAGHGTRMFGPRPELADLMIDWLDKHVKGEAVASSDSALPASSLFNAAWDDRSPFRPGLIGAEANALDQLPGAAETFRSVYHMDLTISPDLQTVEGQQEVHYTNQEDVTLEEVCFHLFPNLLGGAITISAVSVNGTPVEPSYLEGESAVCLPMASPLSPGGQAVIQMAYQVDVPTEGGSNYGVFATVDDVLALAHFYPQIAVYDDEGWNLEPPPPNADVTYADSSFYLVRVTAPADQVIVASGLELDRQSSNGEQRLTLASGPARDFYIASSDEYAVVSRQVGETTINSYGFPEFEESNEQALDIAVAAVDSFNKRFGPYPYTEFDIAPTPNLALGVEYPGVAVVRSALYDPEATLFDGQVQANFLLEGTVAHEVGHQWFYNTVGNDQLDEPWLDESLTQYLTFLYFMDRYGQRGGDGFRQDFVRRWDRVNRADIPIGLPAGDYDSGEYGAIVYGRGPLFFEALGQEMGEESFAAFLMDYYQGNKWGIATGVNLKTLAEAHCNCDLAPVFDEWVGDL